MTPRPPPRDAEQIVFAVILSGVNSLIVSGFAAARAIGFRAAAQVPSHYVAVWMSTYAFAWLIAFPSVFTAAPTVRTLARRIVGAAGARAARR